MKTGTVVVTGASGGFGRRAAQAFAQAGWQVRRYQRGTDLAVAAEGADVIVNAMNPPMYHDWPGLVPKITEQVIAAARASGATVLMPGNVYPYGRQPGPWVEGTGFAPCSRKGRVRAEMEARYAAAAQEGVRVILLRAGDFIDSANAQTLLNMMVLGPLRRNLMVRPGPARTTRAYAYLPDMARAAVALAGMRAELAPYQEVTLPGLHFSFEELRAEIGRQRGRVPRMLPFPWFAMRLAAPFHELSRELLEMRYLYGLDHRLESMRFDGLLPSFRFTPFEQIVAEEIAALTAG